MIKRNKNEVLQTSYFKRNKILFFFCLAIIIYYLLHIYCELNICLCLQSGLCSVDFVFDIYFDFFSSELQFYVYALYFTYI